MESDKGYDLTRIIGKCSIFQILVTLTANCATMSAVWGIMFMTFGAYNPGWICLDADMENVSRTDTSLSQSYIQATDSSSRLLHNNTEWSVDCTIREKCKNLLYNPDSRTIVTEWDLSCESSAIPSIIISIEMTGALIGTLVGGLIGDKFGRKFAMYSYLALHGVSQFLAIFSVSWQMYAVFLFFIGFGAGGVISISYPYPLEFANGWWRAVIVSIPEWNISLLVFVLVVYFLRNWVYIHGISAAVTGIVLLTIFWTPESVRWLTVKGKVDKAKRVVARIARMNGNPVPDTQAVENLAKAEQATMGDHIYTYVDLFKESDLTMMSIKCGVMWMIMGIIYYGLNFGMKSMSGDFYMNLLISFILEFPAILCIAPIVNNFGRRAGALLYISIGFATCFVLVVLFFTTSGGVRDLSVLIVTILCKMMMVGQWGIFSCYLSELYPTVLRLTSFGYVNTMSRVATILSPYVFPNNPDLVYVAFIALAILYLVSFGITWTFPETKGKELTDVIKKVGKHEVDLLESMPIQDSDETLG